MSKFYRVKNWEKWQAGVRPDRRGRLPWIKDYCDREDVDDDFRSLTMFQRAVLEGLARVAGANPSRLIHSDLTYILNTLHVPRSDRPHVPHAIATLTSRGWLIPEDNEDFFADLCAKNEEARPEKGEGSERKPRALSGAEPHGSSSETGSQENGDVAPPPSSSPAKPPTVKQGDQEDFEAEPATDGNDPDATAAGSKFLGETLPAVGRSTLEYRDDVSRDACRKTFEGLLTQQGQSKVSAVLDYLPKNDAFSRGLRTVDRLAPWEWFAEKFDKIAEMMDADEDHKARKQRRMADAKPKDPAYHTGGKSWLS